MIIKRLVVLLISIVLISGCAAHKGMVGSHSNITKTYDKAKKLYMQNKFDDAVGYFNQVIAWDPDGSLAEVSMYYLGKCYEGKRQYAKAIEIFNKLIDSKKDTFWAQEAKRARDQINPH